MRVFNRLNAVSFIALVLTMLSACTTPDNSEPPAELIPIQEPQSVRELWSKDSGAGVIKNFVNLQPLVLDGQLYTIDTKGVIRHFDMKKGRILWVYESGLSTISSLAGEGNSLIITSSEGQVEMLEILEDGLKPLWNMHLNSEIRSRAVMDDEQVFVRTVDGNLSALNASDGKLLWTVSRRVPALSLTGNSYPLVTDDLVISGFDNGKLVAFDRTDGSTVWETSVGIPKGRTEIERLVDLDGQFILRDGVIYVASFQGNLAAVALNSGQIIWDRKFSSYQGIEADDEALYLTDERSHVWAVDRRTGSAFWKQEELNARKLTAPKLLNDNLVVGDLNGFVHLLNKRDGKIVARTRPNENRYIAQPVVYQSTAFVLDSTGQLTAITQ